MSIDPENPPLTAAEFALMRPALALRRTLGQCLKIEIPEACCYVRFGPRPAAGVTSDMIGQTVRGERLIADFDAEGRIIGIELVNGPAKPCQMTPAPDAVDPHVTHSGNPSTRD